jgi:hypothetical protein
MRWSYSSCSCYYDCPAKYRYRYKERHPVEETKHPAAQRGTDIHALFENMLLDPDVNGLPKPFDYYDGFMKVLIEAGAKPEQIIILEKDWTPAPPWSDGWVKSILDAAVVQDSVARNYDWKTGKIYPNHQDQRELYSIMQFCQHPEVEIVIGMHVYVDLKENRSTTYNRSQLPELKAKWEELVRPLYEDEVFAPNPSFGCRSCPYSRANNGPCRF